MRKIKIAGSGPSGLTAAINLARAGFSVEVFERRGDVGCRFSGEHQGLENWTSPVDVLRKLEEMGVKPNFEATPFRRADFFDSKGGRYVFQHESPGFYLVRRGSSEGCLDYALKNQALDEEVKIHFKKTLPLDEADIVATGPSSGDGLGVGVTFKTDGQDIVGAILDDRIAPKGYGYLLISEGRGTLVSAMIGRSKGAPKYLDKAITRFKGLHEFSIRCPKRFSGTASFSMNRPLQQNNRLFVGEAAGLQDLLLGFGIRYAVTSGCLAAQSIIEDRSYEQLLAESGLLNQRKTSAVNRFLYERLGNRGYCLLLRKWACQENIIEYMRNLYAYPIWKRLVYPFIRKT